MSDKLSADIDNDTSHHEEKKPYTDAKVPDLSETGGRRASVALNIVENPLQVCEICVAWLTFSPYLGITANACLF